MARDWQSIRDEYVFGNISYRKLAKKHKVSFDALTRQALKGQWFAERTKHRDRVRTKVQRKTEGRQVYDRLKVIEGLAADIDQLEKDKNSAKAGSKEGLQRAKLETVKTLELLTGGPTERIAGTPFSELTDDELDSRLAKLIEERARTARRRPRAPKSD